MKKFKGTKGKWYIQFMRDETIEDDRPDFWVKSNENKVVHWGTDIMAEDYGEQNGYPKEQRYADAKLIASAPELLKALQSLLSECHKIDEDKAFIRKYVSKETILKAKKVLNKALD